MLSDYNTIVILSAAVYQFQKAVYHTTESEEYVTISVLRTGSLVTDTPGTVGKGNMVLPWIFKMFKTYYYYKS